MLYAQADAYIRQPHTAPYFLLVASYAPHEPAIPAPRYANLPVPPRTTLPPNYDEADVSSKPAWVRNLRRLTPRDTAQIEQFRVDSIRSLQATDDGVARVLKALDETGQRDNTMVIFMSDNGLALGEHRIRVDKRCPYRECLKVPLLVSYPPLTPKRVADDHIALNIDLAPTILDLAGAPIPPSMDGRSLLPLLTGQATDWREDFLIEAYKEIPTDSPDYSGTRSAQYTYVEYSDGERELYDLEKDPYELNNVAGRPAYAPIQARLAQERARLWTPSALWKASVVASPQPAPTRNPRQTPQPGAAAPPTPHPAEMPTAREFGGD